MHNPILLIGLQPNLKPPISTTDQALEYKANLERIDPTIEYLMTLYLSPDLTPDEIRKAKKAGIVGEHDRVQPHVQLLDHRLSSGVKSYPRGVTTNSDGGIESYDAYYPVFEAMEEVDMVLNLHGEVPSDASAVCVHIRSSDASLNDISEHPRYQCGTFVFASSPKTTRTLPSASYRS